jgi:diguanylate cyclase (GGDEF)-like protein
MPDINEIDQVLLVDPNSDRKALLIEAFHAKAPKVPIQVFDGYAPAIDFFRSYLKETSAAKRLIMFVGVDMLSQEAIRLLSYLKTHQLFKNLPTVVLTDNLSEIENIYSYGINSCVQRPASEEKQSPWLEKLIEYWMEANSAYSIAGSKPTVEQPSNSSKVHILLVEDDEEDVTIFKRHLKKHPEFQYNLVHQDTLLAAIDQLSQKQFDVIMLDLGLANSRGLETFECLIPHVGSTPIIALTGNEDDQLALQLIAMGAQDYIVKGKQADYPRIIRYAIERKQIEHNIVTMLHHDSLTNLPNRTLFIDRLKQMIEQGLRYDQKFALIRLYIGDMAQINQVHGLNMGDAMISEIAKKLKKNVRSSDCLSRVSSASFAFLIPKFSRETDGIKKFVQKLMHTFKEPIEIRDKKLQANIQIGVSLFPDHGKTYEALLIACDLACEQARQKQEPNIVIFKG